MVETLIYRPAIGVSGDALQGAVYSVLKSQGNLKACMSIAAKGLLVLLAGKAVKPDRGWGH
jgi:hypothetical protein